MHILFLALHQDHPESEDHRHSDWQEKSARSEPNSPVIRFKNRREICHQNRHVLLQQRFAMHPARKGIFRFPHRQTGAVQYFSVPHPPNVPHSAWLWQSAPAFFRYRWQTCNRRGGDPVTHVLSTLNAFQTLLFFFCCFALFFRSTLAGAQAAWSEKPQLPGAGMTVCCNP